MLFEKIDRIYHTRSRQSIKTFDKLLCLVIPINNFHAGIILLFLV